MICVICVICGLASAKQQERSWAEEILNELTLREKIAQLVQIRINGKFLNRQSPDFETIRDQILKNKVGGVVLFAGNVYESAILLNELQNLSRLPLLVSADFERGASFRIADTTSFPWTMAIGATGSEEFAYQQGLITARESRALGVHWIFAPVLDVNNNPDNPVINIRSFGEDPALVSRLGAAFIRGAKEGGVLTTAKHFPGHGDTSTDSHIGLAVVESDMARLQAVEFVPFRSAIEAGVDSIMTAHVAVPEATGSDNLPATLSTRILNDVLRNTLKFRGLIVTDALEMGAITNSYWCGLAAVRAVQAGADVLLLPTDVTVAINEVERAVKRGDISEMRINESVRKILEAKSRLGLQRNRTVSISHIGDTVASPAGLQLAQNIADRSITAVKDEQRLLPINPLNNVRILSLVLASDLESSPVSVFQTEMRRRFASVETVWGNLRTSTELLANIDRSISRSDIIVCSTLSRLSSGQNTSAIPENQQAIIRKLISSKKPVIWVSFGSPYVLRLAPGAGTYVCTFSYSDVSQVAVAKALSGEIPISGRMPVSIPRYAKVGAGLQIPKLDMTLQSSRLPADTFSKIMQLLDSSVTEAEVLVGYKNSLEFQYRTSKQALNDPELSKQLETISAAMLALDSGRLIPGAPVRDYVPELKKSEHFRIQDLLADIEANTSLIDMIVSRASGMPVEQYVASRLGPLGVNPAGFAQMLLNRGMYDHRRYFSRGTIARYAGKETLWSSPEGSFLWIDPERQLFVVLLTKSAQEEIRREVIREIKAVFAKQ